jgi:hypothetical protein
MAASSAVEVRSALCLALPGAAPLDAGRPLPEEDRLLLETAAEAPDFRDRKLLATEKVPLSAVPARFMNRASSAADF